MKVSTSILSAKDLKKCLRKLNHTSTDYIHLDIMDGIFVKNTTWHLEDVADYFKKVKKPLDVHLMVKDVTNYINEFSFLNPDYITFHLEATEDITGTIEYIKKQGIKAGISIKPNTSVDKLYPYLALVDLVLVMSVEPGEGGQKFIEASKGKIDSLFEYRKSNNLNYLISVDGGINNETVLKCSNADIVVAGNYIISGKYNKNIKLLKQSKE